MVKKIQDVKKLQNIEGRVQSSTAKLNSKDDDVEKNLPDSYSEEVEYEEDYILDGTYHQSLESKYSIIGYWYGHFVEQKLIRFVKVYDANKVKRKTTAFKLVTTTEKCVDDQYFEEKHTNLYEFCHNISHSKDPLFKKFIKDFVMYKYRKTWVSLDEFEEVWNFQDQIKEEHYNMLLETEKENMQQQFEEEASQEYSNDSVPSLNDKEYSKLSRSMKLVSKSTPTLSQQQQQQQKRSISNLKSVESMRMEKHKSMGYNNSMNRIEQGLQSSYNNMIKREFVSNAGPIFKSASTSAAISSKSAQHLRNTVDNIHTKQVQDVTVDSDSQMNLEINGNRSKSTSSFRDNNPFYTLRKTNSKFSIN